MLKECTKVECVYMYDGKPYEMTIELPGVYNTTDAEIKLNSMFNCTVFVSRIISYGYYLKEEGTKQDAV